MKRIVSIVSALALLSPYVVYAADPPPAVAVDTASQDVLFKNGSKARGQVVDIVPGDHVTLRLKTETRRFEWKDVDRVVPASGPEPPPLPPLQTAPTASASPSATATTAPTVAAPTTPPPETLPPVTGPAVKVHINSPAPAHLYRKAAGMQSFIKACDAPCDQEMPLSDEYQVTADGSKTAFLRLNGNAGQTVTIDVSPSSDGGKIGGVLLIIVGSLTFLVGGVIDFAALILESAASSPGSGTTKSSADSVAVVGLVVTGVGLALGVGGIVLLVKSGDTETSQHAAALKQDDRYVRAPVWHTVSPMEQAANRPAATIPLFSRSF